MIITCPKCKTKLNLPDENLKPGETKVKCSKCGAVLVYKGKSRRAPQDSPVEAKPPFSSSPAAGPEASAPSAVPAPERQPMHAVGPLTEQADHRAIRPPDTTAGSRGTDEKIERQKKIDAAYETRKRDSSPVVEGNKAAPRIAVLAGAAAGILVVILLAFFFFSSQGNVTQTSPPRAAKGTTSIPPSTQGPGSQGVISGSAPVGPVQGGDSAQQSPPSNTPPASLEEKAIEMVKISDALLKSTPVDGIIRKWTEENAARYKMVGWQAKKMDEQRYLVSYTALDGSAPKGFYFDVDVQSGVVQDLAKNPELQKKYNIQYSR